MSENWLEELQKAQEDFDRQTEEIERKNKFREWGKLGGRPPRNEVKNVRVAARISEREKIFLDKKSKITGESLSELLRKGALNIPLPDPEKTKILVEYRTNFVRISNFMKKGIWTENEKKELKELLKSTIKSIEKEINA